MVLKMLFNAALRLYLNWRTATSLTLHHYIYSSRLVFFFHTSNKNETKFCLNCFKMFTLMSQYMFINLEIQRQENGIRAIIHLLQTSESCDSKSLDDEIH